jgi:hypothetical protein
MTWTGITLVAAAGVVLAQAPGVPPPDNFNIEVRHSVIGAGIGPMSQVVKNAPYSAQAVSEFTQALADGTRIHRTTSGMMVRDSEGRTRREQMIGAIGPLPPEGEFPQLVIITDPVAGVTYMLNEKEKVANKLPLPKAGELPPKTQMFYHHEGPGPAGGVVGEMGAVGVMKFPSPDPKDMKEESLGTQTIEGVIADGTRTTITIPAGKVGNDRPIETVMERWFSKELQVVVMSKHSDPRVGENVFKLTNIVRAEPSRTLFEVPPDYTVKEAPIKEGPQHPPGVMMRRFERKQ